MVVAEAEVVAVAVAVVVVEVEAVAIDSGEVEGVVMAEGGREVAPTSLDPAHRSVPQRRSPSLDGSRRQE